MQDKHSKTEEATPKRMSDSKKKGQVAKSVDFSSAVSFLIFAMSFGVLAQYLLTNSLDLFRTSFSVDITENLSKKYAGAILMQNAERILKIFLPFGLIAVLVGIITNLVQVGFIFSSEPLKPDFKRLNPIEGIKNMVSSRAMFTLLKNLAKLAAVTYVAFLGIKKVIAQVMVSGQIGMEKIFYSFVDIVKSLGVSIAILMIALGILDLIFQKRSHKKKLMMTKQEIKDEYKEMEGDPKVKSFRRQKQRELSMNRRMQNVEESTVVITNPTHIAIALRYVQGKDQAPMVMAKGLDFVAQKIKEKAKEKGIPIIENKSLARAMYGNVEEGSFVPVELYQAVAEVLAMVYQMDKNKKKM